MRGSDAHHHHHGNDERRVLLAMLLTGVFMVVEIIGGLAAGSLALLADAGHMFTDTAALALAWVAFRIARRPPDGRRSYGYHRFPILAAFVNGLALILIVGWIAVEAVRRLLSPIEVAGPLMLAVAVAGLVVNIIAFAILHGGDRSNLNIRGAVLHVLGDLLGSVAAIVAAIAIVWTGWTPIDPLLSIAVALLILRSGYLLVRQSSHILLEGTPHHLDGDDLHAALVEAVPEVDDVHHVHIWSLSEERPLVTLHAQIGEGVDQQATLRRIQSCLRERFGITHATIQIETGPCADEG